METCIVDCLFNNQILNSETELFKNGEMWNSLYGNIKGRSLQCFPGSFFALLNTREIKMENWTKHKLNT